MSESGKISVVIGANGYIGSHVLQLLKNLGHKVLAFDKDSSSFHKGIPYEKIDVTKKESFEVLQQNISAIFFFSGLTGTRESFDRFEDFVSVNELGLLNLLNHVSTLNKKPRILFPSTRLVYKGTDGFLDENSEKEAKTVYAANKLAGEAFLNAYGKFWHIPWTVARICVPYGNQTSQHYPFGTIGYFLKCAEAGKPINLYGNGSMRRTFTHIEDICRQVVALAFHPQAANEVYNIAGEEYSLKNAAELIANKYSTEVTYSQWPKEDLTLESGNTVFNAKKIISIIKSPVMHTFANWINSLA